MDPMEARVREILGNRIVDLSIGCLLNLDSVTKPSPTRKIIQHHVPPKNFKSGDLVWARLKAMAWEWYPAIIVSKGQNCSVLTITIGDKRFKISQDKIYVPHDGYHVFFCLHDGFEYHEAVSFDHIRTFEEGLKIEHVQYQIINNRNVRKAAHKASKIKLQQVDYRLCRGKREDRPRLDTNIQYPR